MEYSRLVKAAILPGLAALALIAGPVEAPAQSSRPACSGIEKLHYLSRRYIVINPGSQCNMRLRYEVEVQSRTAAAPDICVFIKVAGSDREYGPYCTAGGSTNETPPGPAESIRLDTGAVRLWVKLCQPGAPC